MTPDRQAETLEKAACTSPDSILNPEALEFVGFQADTPVMVLLAAGSFMLRLPVMRRKK